MSTIFSPDTNLDQINDPDRLLDYYRTELASSWRRKVPDIFKAGLALCDAKKRLSRGHFGRLVAEFDMDRSMSARLMRIADQLANVDNCLHSQLPPSVSTLYEMARRGAEFVKEKLRHGDITPETTVEQVRAWVTAKSGTKTRRRPKDNPPPTDPLAEFTPTTPTPPVKPMPAWERLRLYTKDIWSELVEEMTDDPRAGRQHDQEEEARTAAEELAMLPDVANKSTARQEQRNVGMSEPVQSPPVAPEPEPFSAEDLERASRTDQANTVSAGNTGEAGGGSVGPDQRMNMMKARAIPSPNGLLDWFAE
jgi:hypothetical protein